MKNKKTGEIALVLVLLAAFVIVSMFTSNTTGLTEPDYTVFSSTDDGVMLLYDTLKQMGYPVKISNSYISPDSSVEDMQIIVESYALDDTAIQNLAKWVARGGKLLYFDSDLNENSVISRILKIYPPDNMSRVLSGTQYSIGFGQILHGDSQRVTNRSLYESDGEYGQILSDYISSINYRNIYFNEAYHGYGSEKGFFDTLPGEIKIISYQIVLFVIGLVLYLGRRFGKIIPYYEESEREENEYVYTLSNLYMSTGMGNAALSAYDEKFITSAAKYFRTLGEPDFDEICILWQKENIESFGKLQFIKENRLTKINTKKKSGRDKLKKMTEYYRDLINIISRL